MLSFKPKLKTFNSFRHFEREITNNQCGARLLLKSDQIKKMLNIKNK
jgi:hypothetical protein